MLQLGYCNMFVSRTGWSMTLKCFSRGIKCAWLKMCLNESRAYLTYCGLNMSHDSLASIVLPIMDEWDMMNFIKCPKLADSHDIDVFLFFSNQCFDWLEMREESSVLILPGPLFGCCKRECPSFLKAYNTGKSMYRGG